MSDIYVPGVKSRFNTEQLVEELMRVERIPRDRLTTTADTLRNQKTYWQDVGRRMSSLRESARLLFSFQNPFNDRVVNSADTAVITGTATREAFEQEHSFTVTQIAQADRFLSKPLEENYRVEAGTYTYRIGEDEISFNFRGGTLREFTEALNRRGKDKLQASVITVQRGSRSLLIESLVTGADNRLIFEADAEQLAINTGMAEQLNDSRRDVPLAESSLRTGQESSQLVEVEDETLWVGAGGTTTIPVNPGLQSTPALMITFEASTFRISSEQLSVPQPPPGPDIPPAGSVTYGGITIQNDPTTVPIPPWTPPEVPPVVDDLAVLSMTFSDGSIARLPPIQDSDDFAEYSYRLSDLAGNRTITSISLTNRNTHRDVSLRNIMVFDPNALGGLKPLNPVSTAQDAVVSIDGIEIRRPANQINDLIPGVTVTVKGVSDRPVRLGIEPDREAIKDSIISLVGNYNRLMAELNVLTRNDDRVVQELTYLTADEQTELRERLGVFSGDSTLSQLRSSMQRTASAPYPTQAERQLSMLAQIGIGTDVRRAGSSGYDASRLRGYLEIDERVLDAALDANLSAIQQLFGSDTDGDRLVDTGVAYNLDRLTRPYVETGGIISLKTSTIDSRIDQNGRRIETIDRQLAAREAALKSQYAQMEAAYNRMDAMATSLDNFSQQNNNNNR
ncbi:flagellar hook-associated protein 2 [Spirochaetia bacterium]|nr:flagellar hook-associated protein 2 [Spirochaetia bacterium]